MRRNGDFILLKDGQVNSYWSAGSWSEMRARLQQEYLKDPGADYVITQVVGTVDKPAPPVIHSVYESQS